MNAAVVSNFVFFFGYYFYYHNPWTVESFKLHNRKPKLPSSRKTRNNFLNERVAAY